MNLTLTIDFGSTFTKIAAFDLTENKLVAQAQAKTTVESDISFGLESAKEKLLKKISKLNFKIINTIASSSAAGGLKMIAIGLTHSLTTKAAQEAVLGAGAKLIDTYSFKLNETDINALEKICPDLILLSGGTDGGDEENVIYNAQQIAESELKAPIIFAGNKSATKKIKDIFRKKNENIVFVENLFPALNQLNIEPAQQAIRDIYVKRITKSKGLDKLESSLCNIIMPTPRAVLQGSTLIANGTEAAKGWGDLIVLDIGGATTDIHSVGHGYPTNPDVIFKGLPEPFSKRTVEGDLGIRYNATTILENIGLDTIEKKYHCHGLMKQSSSAIKEYIEKISNRVDWIPQTDEEAQLDSVLGEIAVETAISRHVGIISESYINGFNIGVQRGKNLTGVKHIIGTGGILTYNKYSAKIYEASRFKTTCPEELRPKSPFFYRDTHYIMYAIGLLSSYSRESAFKIAQKYIQKII